jgi:hypothetical protein
MTATLSPVAFHGATLYLVEQDGKPHPREWFEQRPEESPVDCLLRQPKGGTLTCNDREGADTQGGDPLDNDPQPATGDAMPSACPSDEPYEVMLRSSRVIRLLSFRQWLTYGGMLCGYPHRDMNSDILSEFVEIARTSFGTGHGVEVLMPKPTAFRPDNQRGLPPDWIPEALPGVACLGLFGSDGLRDRVRGEGSDRWY